MIHVPCTCEGCGWEGCTKVASTRNSATANLFDADIPAFSPQTKACLHGETESIARHRSMAHKRRLIIAVVSLSPVQYV